MNIYFLVSSLRENTNYKDFILGKKSRSPRFSGMFRLRLYYDHSDIFKVAEKPEILHYWQYSDYMAMRVQKFLEQDALVVGPE